MSNGKFVQVLEHPTGKMTTDYEKIASLKDKEILDQRKKVAENSEISHQE